MCQALTRGEQTLRRQAGLANPVHAAARPYTPQQAFGPQPRPRLGVGVTPISVKGDGPGVWRDTKLNRNVALKICRRLRQRSIAWHASREAQTLASLNHPNIAAIYGVEESQDVRALVMELVEGEDSHTESCVVRSRSTRRCPSQSRSPRRWRRLFEQGIIHRSEASECEGARDGTAKCSTSAEAFNPRPHRAPRG